jgi:exopolysaccharide biosynthesis polyprenyl glycosylphosphotransferase
MTAPSTLPAHLTTDTPRGGSARVDLSRFVLPAVMIAADAAALFVAFSLAYALRFKAGIPFLVTPPHSIAFYSSLAFWAAPVWLALFALYRLYSWNCLFEGFAQYVRVVNACTIGMVAVIVISFLEPALLISRGWLVLTWLLSIATVSGLRFGMRRLLRRLRQRGLFLNRTVIVGANDEALALAEQFAGNPGCGLEVVGFVAADSGSGAAGGDLPVLGTINDLAQIARRWRIREVVAATTALSRPELLDLHRTLGRGGSAKLRLSSGLFDILTTGMRVEEVGCVPLMTPQRLRITGIDAVLKSMLDYVSATCLLLLLAPLLLVIALLVKLDSPGPALHRRRVLGESGRPFDAFKFRTMVVDADAVLEKSPDLREAFAKGYKLKHDPRVTRLGRLLRRTSLDELPQLINVVRGEMSLVGPRMIAPDEAARYGKWQLNLLTVMQGITGPWQVEGRNDIPYDERVRLSMQYIRNYSFWLDIEILMRTVSIVLQGKGAY